MKRLVLFLISMNILNTGMSQTFIKKTVNYPVGVYNGMSTWFDVDNDSDLDFIITGQSSINSLQTVVFQNMGAGIFELKQGLQAFSETGLALLDINNDEYIDIILNGRAIGLDNDLTTFLNSNGTYTPTNNFMDGFLHSGVFTTIATGDINNDMFEDVLVSGISTFENSNPILVAKLYLKNTDFSYMNGQILPDPVYLAGSILFDVDGDQDLDLLISGNDGIPPYQRTELFINDQGNFVKDPTSPLVQLQNVSMDAGDYDGDGDPDIIMTGLYGQPKTVLYKNNSGILEQVIGTGLRDHTGLSNSVMWGDFDNDGDLDILFSGYAEDGVNFEIAVNNGNDTFTHFDESNFELLGFGSGVWGDYDNDGDLDILATGYEDVDNPRMLIYENTISISNSPPSTPNGLQSTSQNSEATLAWNMSTDNETAQPSLTYNLSIRDFDGRILHPSYSAQATGFRRVVRSGNMGNSTSWRFQNVPDGIYIWTVQAIDAGYSPSPFSESSKLYVGQPKIPSNLTLMLVSDFVKLTWVDSISNEEYFVIERSLNGQNNFTIIDSVLTNVTSYSDHNLPPSFTALYRVRATNPNGESGYSSEVPVSFDGKPNDLSLTYTRNGIQLRWNDNSFNEDEFVIERMIGIGTFIKIDSVNTDVKEYLDPINEIASLTYRVYAKNDYGITPTSDAKTIVITGLNKAESIIKIFPNPITDAIYVETGGHLIGIEIDLRIVDVLGRTHYLSNRIADQSKLTIDARDLPTGMYLLHLSSKELSLQFKFVK